MSYLVVFVGAGIGGAARHGMNVCWARISPGTRW
jgi:fluoride ion exporter CrcB/FEX